MQESITEIMLNGDPSKLTIIFHASEEGGFTAECLELPGCFSEGETQEEVEANIRLAVNACLGVLFEDFLSRLRSTVDLGSINLQHVFRQERLIVQTPQLTPALC